MPEHIHPDKLADMDVAVYGYGDACDSAWKSSESLGELLWKLINESEIFEPGEWPDSVEIWASDHHTVTEADMAGDGADLCSQYDWSVGDPHYGEDHVFVVLGNDLLEWLDHDDIIDWLDDGACLAFGGVCS